MENAYYNIKKSLENNLLITDYDLLKYAKKLIDENDLYDYIDKILISYIETYGYTLEDKQITINPLEIFARKKDKLIPYVGDLINNKERDSLSTKDLNKINIFNIFAINHEIRHANQARIIFSEFDYTQDNFCIWNKALLEKNEMLKTLDSLYFKQNVYNKCHDYFLDEYEADINAYLETIELLNSYRINELKKLLQRLNKILASNIIFLYKDRANHKSFSTPAKNMLNMYHQLINVLKNNGYEFDIENTRFFDIYKDIDTPKDEFDRLRLGLSINKDTYTQIYRVSKGTEKTLNLFDNIRNI